jgi:branched-subunit amino acid aminotransferase/4-amino-4-deoxychorismate lyase
MVMTITTINGRIVDHRDARVSVFDNSLLYAEGLFETFLAVEDRIVFAREHMQRLSKGVRLTGLAIPVSYERLQQWAKKTLRAHPDRIKKLRLTLTAGESARWVGRQGRPQVIFSAAPHEIPTRPFRLHVSEFRVDHDSVFRQIKTISYAINAASLKRARERGCDDALLLNEEDNVAEVTSANVYWTESGRVFTPPLGEGCLEGVTRRVVLREAKRVGYPIVQEKCPIGRLLEAEELFISSSLKLVIPVETILCGRRTIKFHSGPVAGAFARRIRSLAGID